MKLQKLIATLALASFVAVAAAFAADAKADDKAAPHKSKCCMKAEKDSKACTHECCVAAAKDGKNCEKCGGTNAAAKK